MKGVVIQNAAEVVTPVGGQAKFGREMNDLSRIEHASVVIEDGMIQAVDQTAVIASRYDLRQYERIDAAGQSVIPGFVDSHTHFLFGGYRADEFMLRLTGSTYMELMAAGGGIGSTVRHTRQTGREELYRLGKDRLDAMLAFGITTVEGKSGYGLERETELKQLTVMQALAQDHPLELVSTFMGAHAVPPEYRGRRSPILTFYWQRCCLSSRKEVWLSFVMCFASRVFFHWNSPGDCCCKPGN